MAKYIFIFLTCLSRLLAAQHLAKPLTEKDRLFLDQKLVAALPLGDNISFSYENTDLYNPTKHDSACSKKDIDNLAQKLKGNNSDAVIYMGMGSFYSRLHKPYEADTCFQRSVKLQGALISAYPDSAELYATQAMTYMSMSNFPASKDMARRCLRLNPRDTTIHNLLPMLYIFSGETDSAKMVLMEQIRVHGDGLYSYDFLPLCDFYGFMKKVSTADEAGSKVLASELQQHGIIDFSVIEPYYREDSASVHKNLLYHVAKYLDIELSIIFGAIADTTLPEEGDFKIYLSEQSKEKLAGTEAFFKNCLVNKAFKNKYYPYKVLGNIYFLRGDYKKAIAFTKKAIECKPLSRSKLQINASEDYHNLYSIYCAAKDTLSAGTLALEMLRIKPSIDSSAADFVIAARACLCRKEYEKAKSYYLTAISFGNKSIDAQLGLGVACHLLKDSKQAAYYLDKAYNTDNTDWRVYAISGIISLEQEKADDAYFMLSKSLEIDKNNKWIGTDILKKYIPAQ